MPKTFPSASHRTFALQDLDEDIVQIGFTAGGAATLTFPRSGTGGHLTLSGAAGSHIGDLPTGIQSLPLSNP